MMAQVKKRLESLGYEPVPEDDLPLLFVIGKVEQEICNGTNLREVPEGLRYTAVDMAVGEFLLAKKAAPDGLPGFDLEAAERSISLGDTRVDFGEGAKTPEQRLDALIAHLLKGKGNFAKYRRIQW